MKANTERMVMGADPLNVIADVVEPLPPHVLERLKKGRKQRTQVLDGSMLPQHAGRTPYALTHVTMTFDNEDDVVRCARLLQWSDARMRACDDAKIMWEWKQSFREGMTLEFSVGWYSKEFFEERRGAFRDKAHASYYGKFGLQPSDIKTRHELLKGTSAPAKRHAPARKKPPAS